MTAHFLEDPRLRQRWNQISHTTETVTENAAAGIWSFGHRYINPCLASIASSLDSCTSVCLGDHEERARRRRDRDRARGRAQYSFDFYDDWDQDLYSEERSGTWRNEDWERLLAGKGKRGGGEVQEQPRGRKGGMSYGTRGVRKKSAVAEEDDPTIIPSTARLGFLGRLPFKFGGPLRYKPSAANLQEHPAASKQRLEGELEPLLGMGEDEHGPHITPPRHRNRSGTTGSEATSDSYRSRGDLFPSDGEGEFEDDAVPLDDEFAVALGRVDDRSSDKTMSSKGKRKVEPAMPRSVSRTTIASTQSGTTQPRYSIAPDGAFTVQMSESMCKLSLEDVENEEEEARQAEDREMESKRQAAARLAHERGFHSEGDSKKAEPKFEAKSEGGEIDCATAQRRPDIADMDDDGGGEKDGSPDMDWEVGGRSDPATSTADISRRVNGRHDFVPARLPYFR